MKYRLKTEAGRRKQKAGSQKFALRNTHFYPSEFWLRTSNLC